jgi:hypothetical protein
MDCFVREDMRPSMGVGGDAVVYHEGSRFHFASEMREKVKMERVDYKRLVEGIEIGKEGMRIQGKSYTNDEIRVTRFKRQSMAPQITNVSKFKAGLPKGVTFNETLLSMSVPRPEPRLSVDNFKYGNRIK